MKALATFLRKEVEVIGAGRTDAGVHALRMMLILIMGRNWICFF